MSHVAMEKLVCPICGVVHQHNAGILINKKLRNIDPKKTITGYGMCENDQDLFDKGYVALVAAETPSNGSNVVKQQHAIRTGEICHVKREAFDILFSEIDIADSQPLVFIEPNVMKMLAQRFNEEVSDSEKTNH